MRRRGSGSARRRLRAVRPSAANKIFTYQVLRRLRLNYAGPFIRFWTGGRNYSLDSVFRLLLQRVSVRTLYQGPSSVFAVHTGFHRIHCVRSYVQCCILASSLSLIEDVDANVALP